MVRLAAMEVHSVVWQSLSNLEDGGGWRTERPGMAVVLFRSMQHEEGWVPAQNIEVRGM